MEDGNFSELAKPQHFSCYDREWQALEAERQRLGLHTRFDVIRHYMRMQQRLRRSFKTPRAAKEKATG